MKQFVALCPSDAFPYMTMIVNEFRGCDTDIWSITDTVRRPELHFFSEDFVLSGDFLIAKYFARLDPHVGLYGHDAFTSTQIDSWVRLARKQLTQVSKMEELVPILANLNRYLHLRTFFSTNTLTLADIGVWVTLSFSEYSGISLGCFLFWSARGFLYSISQRQGIGKVS
eukprot:TRINITY_DN2377_c0_g1_i5.p1 TRINITY_DN2377_c0_g1~~TRINITY_DN2377_c0_g1_i5.p1  ORF type:complete len:170 (-),score=23.18 TRINITY_DN2377_c0_g1_i5:730-1239(-)